MKFYRIGRSTLLVAIVLQAMPTARATDATPFPAGTLAEVASLLDDASALAGQPEVEVGALSSLLDQIETFPESETALVGPSRIKSMLRTLPLRQRILTRLAELALPEVLNALALDQDPREVYGDGLWSAWAHRAIMPTYFARNIFESILAIAPRSRRAQALTDTYESYDDNMGVPRAEYFVRLRRAQREFLLAREAWPVPVRGEPSDPEILSNVIDSISCGPSSEPEPTSDEKYPIVWKDSDARDLVEQLGTRLLALPATVDSIEDADSASISIGAWIDDFDQLADQAAECGQLDWVARLRKKQSELKAIDEDIRAGKGKVIPSPEEIELTSPPRISSAMQNTRAPRPTSKPCRLLPQRARSSGPGRLSARSRIRACGCKFCNARSRRGRFRRLPRAKTRFSPPPTRSAPSSRT